MVEILLAGDESGKSNRYITYGFLIIRKEYISSLVEVLNNERLKNPLINRSFEWKKVKKQNLKFYKKVIDIFNDSKANFRYVNFQKYTENDLSILGYKEHQLREIRSNIFKEPLKIALIRIARAHEVIGNEIDFQVQPDRDSQINKYWSYVTKSTEIYEAKRDHSFTMNLSEESDKLYTLIELADLLCGMTNSRINNSTLGESKEELLMYFLSKHQILLDDSNTRWYDNSVKYTGFLHAFRENILQYYKDPFFD